MGLSRKDIQEQLEVARNCAVAEQLDAIFRGERRNVFVVLDFPHDIKYARHHDIAKKEITISVSQHGKVIWRVDYLADGFAPILTYEQLAVETIVGLYYRSELV